MESPSIAYLKELAEALSIEQKTDFELFKKEFLQADIHSRRKNGLTWFPVIIKKEDSAFGDMLLLELERTQYLDEAHQFTVGKNIGLFTRNHDTEEELTGVVKAVHGNSMSILLTIDELPDWVYDGKIGVNALFDSTSYSEMQAALNKVIHAQSSRIAELREIFHGNLKATFSDQQEDLLVPNLNLSQNKAVRKALSASDVALIHGPPGTGKTTTLIHIIRLISSTEKQVLVCAPTNTAVDLLTEKLKEQGLDVLRLGHPARISEDLLAASIEGKLQAHPQYKDIKTLHKNAEEYFRMAGKYKRVFGKEDAKQRTLFYTEAKNCKKEARLLEDYIIQDSIDKAQVICCTPVLSNSFYLKTKSFGTLVLDEASQLTEPLCWIPLLKCKRVILAGDHYQLPPVIKSIHAAKLKETLFELCIRLNGISELLTRQYRMHNDVMRFSNKHFYEGKLIADSSIASVLLSYDENQRYLNKAVEFIDTAGCGMNDELNPESMSTMNRGEITVLREHLNRFCEEYCQVYQTEMVPLTIGIIAPYKAQIELLKQSFIEIKPPLPIPDLQIKTIDSFQGEEMDVIYISFVRSNEQGEIGFLSDVRRTNVAMTRAKKKLVMIGDSATLGVNPFYSDLVQDMEEHNAYSSAWEFIS